MTTARTLLHLSGPPLPHGRMAEAFSVAIEQLAYWRRIGVGNEDIFAELGAEPRRSPSRDEMVSVIAAAWLGVVG
jgi:hypothetical protein